ncbi:arginyltransferase [Sedimenticola sp.]|uniref:arginyltransferase n=1 Tax=Sedimenticola sp. TaxID=1940285 RepID=UPI003D11AEC5
MIHETRETRTIQLYQSAEHPCAYLDQKQSRSLFVDPHQVQSMRIYEALIDQGFRRSGDIIYRPDCLNCNQCISLRIPVAEFSPRRIQRRIWNRHHEHFRVVEQTAEFNPDHFALFKRYIHSRHPDGEMEETSEAGYQQFIASSWSNSRSFTFYYQDRLVAVAVADILRQGLSAVYTFFDPEIESLSPGVFCLLWQINECKRRHLPWLYLGYWVPDCRKMSYKSQYLPHDAYINGTWVRIQRHE